MLIFFVLLYLIHANGLVLFKYFQRYNRIVTSQNISPSSLQSTVRPTIELEKCLQREYATFFSPMDTKFYREDVVFEDPMTTLSGVGKYQENVDLLGGRTGLGGVMFKDAFIVLHNIEIINKNTLQTRWTLQLTVKVLPWQPRPKFTGVSVYTLDNQGKVAKQVDYWDSINLKNGEYTKVSIQEGISDFLSQLKNEDGAQMAAPELPYQLLRRAKRYEVRRYPAQVVAETTYTSRPEGYDRIGSYCGGSNVNNKPVSYYSPTLMRILDKNDGNREKLMTWPLQYLSPGKTYDSLPLLPEPTIPKLTIRRVPEKVVAVTRFEVAATEPIVKGFTGQLLSDVKRDGLEASTSAITSAEIIVGQYDALFSLNKRRNEVWVELSNHPWKQSGVIVKE